MAFTQQQTALARVTELFGKGSFTSDHVDYRRVGCTIGEKWFSAIGSTWDEAIEKLKEKVQE